GTDFAALVLGADEESLKVLLYSFAEEPLDMAMRTWRLEHGRYEWTLGIDADGDDDADRDIARRELELLRHAQVPFTLPPRQTAVIQIRQLERLDALTKRSDLALSPRDVEREDGRTLAVTVHNIGAARAQDVPVALLDAGGSRRATAIIARIEPPADVKLKTATVELAARSKIGDNWRVVIDPMNRIQEICETNNAMVVGEAGARSPFVELPPPRAG
ncbi:MAG: CARDB domain-containing protein, partial [Armatimonadota bacterium]